MKIFHLSDLHLNIDNEKFIKCRWNLLIKELKKDPPDIIVFTGDLINALSKTRGEDIKLANKLFFYLINELNFSDKLDHIIFTPGNHDVPYDVLTHKNKKVGDECENTTDDLIDGDNWYIKFINELKINGQNKISTFEKINILNLNTTIGICAKDTQQKICISCNFLKKELENPILNESNINILMTHYSPDDFSTSLKYNYNNDSNDITLYNGIKEKFNLILHGHNHKFGENADVPYIKHVGADSFAFETVSFAIYDIDTINKSMVTYKLNFDKKTFTKIIYKKEYLYNTDKIDKSIFLNKILNSINYTKKFLPQNDIIKFDAILNNNKLYYKDNVYDFGKMNDLYNSISKFKSGAGKFPDYLENVNITIFDKIDLLIKNSFSYVNNEPLIIKGAKGVGKTTFLITLNLYLLNVLKKDGNYVPIIIDANKYDNIKILKKDIIDIKKKFEKRNLVFFIDGIDDKIIYNNSIENLNFLEYSENVKVIYCIDSHKASIREDSSYERNKNAAVILYINPINIYDKNKINKLLESYFNLTKEKFDKDEIETLKKRFKQLDLLDIDLNLLINFSDDVLTEQYINVNLDEIYKKYCEKKGIKFDDIANMQLAYDYIYTDKLLYKSSNSEKIINDIGIVDYLLANYLVYSFCNEHDDSDMVIKTSYPRSVTRFTTLIINKQGFQEKFKNNILAKLNCKNNKIKNKDAEIKMQCFYLLGRLKNIDKMQLIKILKNELNAFKNSIENTNDEKEIACYRTLFIAIHYLDPDNNLLNLVDTMICNPLYAEINRKFQLDYYGDTRVYNIFRDFHDHIEKGIINECYKCYFALENRIEIYLEDFYSSKFNSHLVLDLFTLANILQIRLQNKIIKQEDLSKFENIIVPDYYNLIKKAVNVIENRLTNLQKMYFDSILFDFEYLIEKHAPNDYETKPIISYNKYSLFEKLCEQQRIGWLEILKNDDKILKIESIAEHTYLMYNLAFFYLPEAIIPNNEYNKQDMLQFIMLHDLIRSFIGDIIPSVFLFSSNDVTDSINKSKIEKKLLIDLIISGTYWNESNFVRLYKFFETGQKNERIMNDLDNLQFLCKLFYYYKSGNIDDITFGQKLKENKLKTEEIKKIYKIIIINNDEFADIIKNFKKELQD